ncbi:class I SAM-dependent methyltransferase [Galbibacter sp. EGI 63066]|uniref:class I SAM-dependent methyltransferase n=1 Tax=Galbibacter sp. EGI 63066 TaxID=2993559 RepID=UPI0022499CA1|nr:class I SAM-dependent methyltransferase [Galbibacter sp. EGI 63066]MCX2681538.1 class I SAM-dependent methyltransferase [Galbibacter sp. EGI 63066]
MKDLLGKAISDYYSGNFSEDLLTETSISEEDVLPITYLFRNYDEMPAIEQKALDESYGKVLDVGCGAGSHALYLQSEKKLDVTAMEISEGAVETCKKRGVQHVVQQDVFQLKDEKFDTILMLMNGTGLFGTYAEVPQKLLHLKGLLNDNGQILIDSSDIIFMFDEDDDGGKWVPLNNEYYGEVKYTLKYKGETETTTWLYLDFNTLKNICDDIGLKCELLTEGEHYDYLVRIMI